MNPSTDRYTLCGMVTVGMVSGEIPGRVCSEPHETPGVAFTVHAVARYIERVKPSLNPERARRECEALAALGYTSTTPPRWINFDGDCEGYLCCGDVAFPLKQGHAVTCLVRGLMPASVRARRNRDRARRTFAATHKRHDNGRPIVVGAA